MGESSEDASDFSGDDIADPNYSPSKILRKRNRVYCRARNCKKRRLDEEERKETKFDKKMGGIIAECDICPNKKKIKGSLRVSSNFITHLKIHHKAKYISFFKEKTVSNSSERSKNSFNEKLLKFVCDTFSPLRIVDNPSFRALFPKTQKIPSRNSLTKLLAIKTKENMRNLKEKLSNVNCYCMTADIWSGNKRSFFGYTCYWIDCFSYKRCSVALACSRFKGSHTYDKIANLIKTINDKFGIEESKVMCVVSDNGSNFVKAFKQFGVVIGSILMHANPVNEKDDYVVGEDFTNDDNRDSDDYYDSENDNINESEDDDNDDMVEINVNNTGWLESSPQEVRASFLSSILGVLVSR